MRWLEFLHFMTSLKLLQFLKTFKTPHPVPFNRRHMMGKEMIYLAIIVLQLSPYVAGKECTNIPTQLSSHTLRYELLKSKNETWKREILSHYHVTPTDDAVWSSLFPRKMLREEDERGWDVMYRKIKNSGGVKGMPGLLNEVSLHDVRLDPDSMHGTAQQTNLDYLMMLDVDRLVWSFRKTAGLETPGQPYGGWESPKTELRGHFVGHYLSASAQMWASTHNESLKAKMDGLVSALGVCQQRMGTGYLSAFPSELFDRFEAIKPVWAPYYTIHKILAGLLDQYTLAGNEEALKMMVSMVDYFYNRVQNVVAKYTIERHWASLNEETGGMNDVLYKLYSITGDQKHLTLGHLFDKPCFLGMLAVKADSLSGFHANTHIPVVVGTQTRYEVTGDPLYKEIGTYFMDVVNSSHSYATGGTSVSEFWSDPRRLASTLLNETEESCTTYNMLKVSRHLFRWTKEMAYADYYERALTNGVLSIQRGRDDPGIMIYMLPLVRGASKAHTYHGWGTKYDSFWCCYGTGIESFSKLGDSIYFEEGGKSPSLYIIQYISSSINWRSGKIVLNQKVDRVSSSDQRLRVVFTITSREQTESAASTLKFRIPFWTSSNTAKASLNGQDLPLPSPGSFLSVSRNWSPADKITFELPISLRTEAIKDERPGYASLQAILYGPYLLAGLTQVDWDINAKSPDWITPIPQQYTSQLISLSQQEGDAIRFVSNSNNTLKMAAMPQQGSNAAASSTFRLVMKYNKGGRAGEKLSAPSDAVGELVMLEPFDLPGMAVVHHGEGKALGVADASESGAAFRLVDGVDGKDGSVSLESEDEKGCFVYSGSVMELRCSSGDDGFKEGASFTMRKGFNEYHPISFVAKGMQRNFLLSPLLSVMDESYTVYFNIHS